MSVCVCVGVHGQIFLYPYLYLSICAYIVMNLYTHIYTRIMPTALDGGAARQRRRTADERARARKGTQRVLEKGYSKGY